MSTESASGHGVTRVEFSLTSPEYPFVGVSVEDGGRMVLEENVVRGDGICSEFFRVEGVRPERIVELAEVRDGFDARTLAGRETGGLVEVIAADDCPLQFLAERGALPVDAHSVDGEGRVVADIPDSEDVGSIVREFLESHPDAVLVSKRSGSPARSILSGGATSEFGADAMTDRQREVLVAAQEAGYYDWPRETNGSELAEQLDVTPPTLHKHLRAAEGKIVADFVERCSRPFETDR
ncbi:helix-turn-helix domain-containing protein [Halorarum salinum]|uniref:Helix-turn-helix domain-containing protein n=1 Tax=Halorarum salinum TaxID=2743089 RepID=A0A7D5LB20_9EURY|nr:bacterio-opsin activator domain-containing protein [Halobaculum salinum]QLG62452.1 helix-turn-helix domain-containing protein [Halobaculum salinum]